MEFLNATEHAIKGALPPSILQQYELALSHQNTLSKDFPLMNPFHVILITLAYIVSIFVGRSIMQNRQRFELKTFSLLHNAVLILLSLYMCVETLRQAMILEYSIFGNGAEPVPKAMPLARVLWVFYFSKILEFVDTWIMILNKNDRQISFLHVYHHSTIFIIWWAVIFYAPGGETYFSAAQNSGVHVLMYTYYFLTTLGVSVPYKRYITQIQMLQFALNLVQSLYCITHDTPYYPKFLGYLLFFYMLTLLALFYNFYRKNLAASKKVKSS